MIKACYIVVVVGLLCGVAWEGCAQDLKKVDSLKQVLQEKRGKGRVDVLWELSKYYASQMQDNVTALGYIEEAYAIAREAPVDSLQLVTMGRRNVAILYRLERYKECLAILSYILPIAQRNGYAEEIDLCESSAGLIHMNRGDYDRALFYNLRCLQYREDVHDSLGISITLHNIGNIYLAVNFLDKSQYYNLRSLKIKRLIRSHYDENVLCSNIGLCYWTAGDYEKAFNYAYMAKKLCNQYGFCNQFQRCYLVLGFFHAELENYDSARFYAEADNAEFRDGDINYLMGEKFRLLARIANDNRHFDEALRYARDGESYLLRIRSKIMLTEIYEQCIRSCNGLKRYEAAVYYRDKYQAYKDSLLNEQIALLLTERQVAFDQKQNQTRLALQESTVQWQGHQNFWIALIGGLLIIAIELLIYDYTGRKRETQILETMVHDRTRALHEKVRTLEREETERKAWEQKIDRSFRDGNTRLDALGDIVAHTKIKTALRNFRGAQQTDPLKTSAET